MVLDGGGGAIMNCSGGSKGMGSRTVEQSDAMEGNG